MAISNEQTRHHPFLQEMYEDDYFPNHLVTRGCLILQRLCMRIEAEPPAGLDALYLLTHAATEEFNALAVAFENHDSEIETAARECIAADFKTIARAYGFAGADIEEMIAPREW